MSSVVTCLAPSSCSVSTPSDSLLLELSMHSLNIDSRSVFNHFFPMSTFIAIMSVSAEFA